MRTTGIARGAVALAVLAALTLGGLTLGAPAASAQGDSLYKRLGGYDALAAVTDEFIGRMATDPTLRRFFDPISNDTKGRIRQQVVEQLCQATGGPCIYTGRSMKVSHAGSGISENDWDIAVKHLVATLDKFNVPDKEKGEVASLLGSLKADIVEKP
jgi:hemoglobin